MRLDLMNDGHGPDGAAPNPSVGLLRCPGPSDGPCPPSRPFPGNAGIRSPADPARGPDRSTHGARALRPDGRRWRVAVIGAGAAGAFAARTLADRGHAVSVYEKSRGLGGRMATRREGAWRFDHGAQYLRLRNSCWEPIREDWIRAGILAPWDPEETGGEPRWVGVPGMNALVHHLLAEQPVRRGLRIEGLARDADGWRLRAGDTWLAERFDAVLLAIPAPQASALLPERSGLAAALAPVRMAPCWSVLAVAAGLPRIPRSMAWEPDAPVTWVARDASKPGRDTAAGTWVVQAGVAWSEAHLENAPERVAPRLWQALAAQLGEPLPAPAYLRGHRWRYARVAQPLGQDCLWDPAQQLGACGDWCRAGRVEAALLSGAALAGRVSMQAAGQD